MNVTSSDTLIAVRAIAVGTVIGLVLAVVLFFVSAQFFDQHLAHFLIGLNP